MDKDYNQVIDDVCKYICYEWSLDKINTCGDFERIASELKEIYAKQNENNQKIYRCRSR